MAGGCRDDHERLGGPVHGVLDDEGDDARHLGIRAPDGAGERVGRAVTAMYAPSRPDYAAAMFSAAKERGLSGTPNQWVIDTDFLIIEMMIEVRLLFRTLSLHRGFS